MTNLYLHIGLPKTATTALQRHAFGQIQGDELFYVGVRSPRHSSEQSEAYRSLLATCNCDADKLADCIAECQRLLSRLAEEYSNLLISEEMVCVDGKVNWQEKFSRLRQVTSIFNTRILAAIRDPIPGMYSLYIEQWHKNKDQYPEFEDYFNTCNQARIFNYKESIGYLEQLFDEQPLKLIPFELLKEGRRYLVEFESVLGTKFELASLPRENKAKDVDEGVWTRNVGLIDWLKKSGRGSSTHGDSTFRQVMKTLAKPVTPWLKRTTVPGSGQLVSYPDFASYNERIQDSNQWLLDKYGICYLS